jgi:hypothetical protein
MEQILGSFSIGLLLRSLFAGVFFVASYYVAAHGSDALVPFLSSDNLGKNVAASLFSGVVGYAFHRSLVYPAVVESWINLKRVEKFRMDWPLVGAETIKLLAKKWDESAEGREYGLARSKHLSTWADFAHLQYASALCIVLGALFGSQLKFSDGGVYWPLASVVGLQILAALVSDWRLHAVRENLPPIPETRPNMGLGTSGG